LDPSAATSIFATDMEKVQQATKMQREAQRIRLLAPTNDPIGRAFELELANGLVEDLQALLMLWLKAPGRLVRFDPIGDRGSLLP